MGSKTEKPTPKRLNDAAQKGQMFKSKDVIISFTIFFGIQFVLSFISFDELMNIWVDFINHNFSASLSIYLSKLIRIAFMIIIPILFVVFIISAIPTFFQTKFTLATKALNFNVSALNPVNGFKRIFSVLVIKDFLKSLLYIIAFFTSGYIVLKCEKHKIFSQIYTQINSLLLIWQEILLSLLVVSFVSIFVILVFDVIAGYFIFMKDMKMELYEVRQEIKEQNGNPEVKSQRQAMHREILSEQVRSDIENSNMLIVNPTHIAIGIYINTDIFPAPIISVKEKDERALAARRYAQEKNVPIINDRILARHLYATYKIYSVVGLSELDEILRILKWLKETDYNSNPNNE
ncbi:EscU/YscU/HrcU family type III secretion system export apparatus switch protein [Citrobacter sp. wls826]|uniref:EscU/YscU/HrcU family type III secretion system export apparatus switch protein n=1 Tax=Citrobacter sp. wls826 TaxID=2576415 RepID=UPI0010C9712E|nr:EscU/YscU/HrcU family type III secretion system export apparatus switch protein [Citrobacter sp. wls826]TKU24782.1 EscU/YscU/HrcU family type III secretion system export apparatus switch protein [Citrobacter sp. wls826]TKV30107.1 EscU/YscU/HrcU family type III secretion system export apparatus switch protein [Citrobacter sp. TBCS-11]